MPTTEARGRPAHPDVLTLAEWRVAEDVRHGMTNRVIAERQGVSLNAVKFHVANVLSKLGLASRVELKRWDGIRRDSALGRCPASAPGSAPLGDIGQIARSVGCIATATAWYRDVLGLTLLYSFERLAFFACGDMRLMLSEGDGAAESIFYFRVPDIRAAHEDLTRRGVVFVSAPHRVHRHDDGSEEWMAFFEDPERRPLGLMSVVPVQMAKDGEDV
ncbi:LuxR C-terminal-related transcriptional regulator [Brevundimonas sp. BT-123]|uniref:LuxR C-terminal-related transcriptional regulator n=1 Tax=Brevundimonas sp. BT-123 TaxID=2986928 RepID=UPI00223630B9|nr:LuxR C-terminal-related transcriptional regulator [Brevundimonas sp. BT-123]MCW0047680.1 LuxR C-terminal-related transcriptional regulator [Brevundimonas sp. BT-123]